MVRSPCCDMVGLKKGPWSVEEDHKLVDYIMKNGHGSWRNLPKSAGLNRCGKSCRLRWTNYLRPDIKRGKFSEEEERLIVHLHSVLGNKWSAIATSLSGRTDNEIKNYWNTHLKKKLLLMGLDPVTHRRRTDLNLLRDLRMLIAGTNFSNIATPSENQLTLQADAAQLARFQILQRLAQIVTTFGPPATFDSNYNFNDIIQLSSQLGVLMNGTITLAQNPIPTNYDHNNLQSYFTQETVSHMNFSCSNDGYANQMVNSYNLAASSSTLPFASHSTPEINVMPYDHHKQEPINSNNISIDSSNFTGLEGLGDLETDLFWKDIVDKISRDGRL